MARFFEPPPWLFVVTTLDGAVLTFLSRLALSRAVTYTLNKPATATFDVPSDEPEVNILAPDGDPFISMNNRLLYGFRRDNECANVPGAALCPWSCRYGGILMQPNDEIAVSTDTPTTHVASFDSWQYLMSQPVLNSDGILPGRNGLSYDNTPGSDIVIDLLNNLLTYNLALAGAGFPIPLASQSAFLNWGQSQYLGDSYGSSQNPFFTGHFEKTVEVSVNFKQGQMLGDALDQLTNQMGALDIIITPVFDPINQPGILGMVNIYQLAGQNQYQALFAWDKPGRSLVGMNRLVDGQQMANIVQGYAGTAGSPVFPLTGLPDAASLAKFGPYWLQQTMSSQVAAPDAVAASMAAQLILRRQGKLSLTVDPGPEMSPQPFFDYFLGDFVPVYASSNFRQAMGANLASPSTNFGFQRIYSIPVTIPDDAPETVNQLLMTIPDQVAS